MQGKFKEKKDVIIPSIIAIIFMALGSALKIDNKIIEYLISNVIPILIMTVTIILNKPSVYLKYFTFTKKNKNIKLGFTLKYSNIKIDDMLEYKNIINGFISKYTGDIKILRQNIGNEVCLTSFIINAVNYEINYDDVGESLTILITSQLNYKGFFDKIEKAIETITDIAGKSKLVFNRSFTKISIEFLENKENLSNPFFKKIYLGFNVRYAEFKFITKKDTTVMLTNSCINFISNESATQLIKDIRNFIFI
ncbi:hypothetical protein FDF26_12720 [Clostridium botulinum]|nr:hypothetical protein [Clostridium botulinum]